MPEQELREVIARVITYVHLRREICYSPEPFDVLQGKADEAAALLDSITDEELTALSVLTVDVTAAVKRYGAAAFEHGLERGFIEYGPDRGRLAAARENRDAAERDLLALVAVARPGVRITDALVADLQARYYANLEAIDPNWNVSDKDSAIAMKHALEDTFTPEATDEH